MSNIKITLTIQFQNAQEFFFFFLNNSVKNARTYGHKRVTLLPHDVTQYNKHTKSNSTN
jgi:hypothetical protein